MDKIIIDASQYGATKKYAEKSSKLTSAAISTSL